MSPYKVAGVAALFLGVLVGATGCYAEPVYAGPAYGGSYAVATGPAYAYATYDYPPAAYVSTTTPYYYGGRATYFYNNRWYYQDGGRWAYYNREPYELGQYRARYYARPAGGAYVRSGGYVRRR